MRIKKKIIRIDNFIITIFSKESEELIKTFDGFANIKNTLFSLKTLLNAHIASGTILKNTI